VEELKARISYAMGKHKANRAKYKMPSTRNDLISLHKMGLERILRKIM
jgi:hypothetical protein